MQIPRNLWDLMTYSWHLGILDFGPSLGQVAVMDTTSNFLWRKTIGKLREVDLRGVDLPNLLGRHQEFQMLPGTSKSTFKNKIKHNLTVKSVWSQESRQMLRLKNQDSLDFDLLLPSFSLGTACHLLSLRPPSTVMDLSKASHGRKLGHR